MQHQNAALVRGSLHVDGGLTAINRLRQHAHWLPRVAFSSVFLYHGIGKFATLEAFAMMMMIPMWVAALVAAAEVAGACFVMAGGCTSLAPRLTADRLTRLGGAVIAPVMVGAIAMFHWGQWSFVPTDSHPMGGMEFQLVLLAIALYFVLRGNDD